MGAPDATTPISAANLVADPDFGAAYRNTAINAGFNVMTRGVLAVAPDRVYEVRVRFKIESFGTGTTMGLGPVAAGLKADYTTARDQTGGAIVYDQLNTVYEASLLYSLTAGPGITTLHPDTKFIRGGLRLNAASTGGVALFGSIEVRDVTEARALADAQSTLTSRVTSAEGAVSSQGQSITNLGNTIAGKADASALQGLEARVTSTEGVNTSQGTAITNLNNALPGKADASALSALENKVTQQDGNIVSTAKDVRRLKSSLASTAMLAFEQGANQIEAATDALAASAEILSTARAETKLVDGKVTAVAETVEGLQAAVGGNLAESLSQIRLVVDESQSQATKIEQLRAAVGEGESSYLVKTEVGAGPAGYPARHASRLQSVAPDGTVREVGMFFDIPADPTKPPRLGFNAGETVFFDANGNPISIFDASGAFLRAAVIPKLTSQNIDVAELTAAEGFFDRLNITWSTIANAVINNFRATSANIEDLSVGRDKIQDGAFADYFTGRSGSGLTYYSQTFQPGYRPVTISCYGQIAISNSGSDANWNGTIHLENQSTGGLELMKTSIQSGPFELTSVRQLTEGQSYRLRYSVQTSGGTGSGSISLAPAFSIVVPRK